MNKEMTIETNDEVVDLSRRSMMGRFGLMASLVCAAPVLMTMSTAAVANHKDKDKANKGDCKTESVRNSDNPTAISKVCPDVTTTPPGPTPGEPITYPS